MTAILLIILISLAKTIGLIFLIILPMVSYTVYAERRVCALIQDRRSEGPETVWSESLWARSTDRRRRKAVVEGRFYASSRKQVLLLVGAGLRHGTIDDGTRRDSIWEPAVGRADGSREC